MGDKKGSRLPILPKEELELDDLFYIAHDVTGSPSSKAITWEVLKEYLGVDDTGGGPDWEPTSIKQVDVGLGGILILTENGKLYAGRSKGNDDKPSGLFTGLTIYKSKISPTYGVGSFLQRVWVPSESPIIAMKVYGSYGIIIDSDLKTYQCPGKMGSLTYELVDQSFTLDTGETVEKLLGIDGGFSADIQDDMQPIYLKTTNDNIYYWSGSSWSKVSNLSGIGIKNVIAKGPLSPILAWSDEKVFEASPNTNIFNDITNTILNAINNDYPLDDELDGKPEVLHSSTIKKCGIGYDDTDWFKQCVVEQLVDCIDYILVYDDDDDSGSTNINLPTLEPVFKENQNRVCVVSKGSNHYGQCGIGYNNESETEWEDPVTSYTSGKPLKGTYMDYKIEGLATPAVLIGSPDGDIDMSINLTVCKCGYNYNDIISVLLNDTQTAIWRNSCSGIKILSSEAGKAKKNSKLPDFEKSKYIASYVLKADGSVYAQGPNKGNDDSKCLNGTGSPADESIMSTMVLIPPDKNYIALHSLDTGFDKSDASFIHNGNVAYIWGDNSNNNILISSVTDDLQVPVPISTYSQIIGGLS